ncbi:MAG: threonine/serine dehydratase [Xanthomonadaceae bacterium]|nr:threonine/serine dehydratase [Xanthomonadaceae bacterium]MDE2054987.1 threonine/serine dehydratase [Xanthomonadaceae bacterium]
MSDATIAIPSVEEIRTARERLGERVRETPVWHWRGDAIDYAAGVGTQVFLKLELFQYTGTFKARGALLNAMALSAGAKQRGVTAVSAGNHAIAVAFAARAVGTTAKVVMPKTANPARVALCRSYGAEVVLTDDVFAAFAEVKRIEADEGRTFIHPFEGELTVLGTATVGYELCNRIETLDAVIVPVGGGGLIAGVACAVKQMQPHCKVYGVEPEGADSMSRSFAAGTPQKLERVDTIADSLAAPYALPYSFGVARQFVDEVVTIPDAAMQSAMALLFADMKLAVEPAGAAATAALCGPLRERLDGQRIGLIVCGTNIDLATFTQQANAAGA